MLSDHPDESSPENNQPQSLSGQLLTTPTDQFCQKHRET